MAFKKTFFVSLCVAVLGFSLLGVSDSLAMSSTPIEFKPNIPIPGSEKFGGDTITFDEHDGSILALYIRDLYDYGAGMAGAVALFMLVFAGWKWLMAAGSAEKVAAAKSIVNNVLIGLALLFGGYLLLAQISDRLVNLRSLVVIVPEVTADTNKFCSEYDAAFSQALESGGAPTCGRSYREADLSVMEGGENVQAICLGNICEAGQRCIDAETRLVCPQAISLSESDPNCFCETVACSDMRFDTISLCHNYTSIDSCNDNICYGKEGMYGEIMDEYCLWDDSRNFGYCRPARQISCDSNSDCEDIEGWCCEASGGWDFTRKCRPSSETTCMDH